jgi:hypothetical protein
MAAIFNRHFPSFQTRGAHLKISKGIETFNKYKDSKNLTENLKITEKF